MLKILLNNMNFDRPWAADTMQELLSPDMTVGILELGENDLFENGDLLFREETGRERRLMRPFRRIGFLPGNIRILHATDLELYDPAEWLPGIDVLFVCGSDAVECRNRMADLGLDRIEDIFDGILIAVGAAASVCAETCAVYYEGGWFEEIEGLGLIRGFDLDMQYTEDASHIGRLIRLLESRGRTIIVCPEEGGILMAGNEMALIGSAFAADYEDLDELYALNELQ